MLRSIDQNHRSTLDTLANLSHRIEDIGSVQGSNLLKMEKALTDKFNDKFEKAQAVLVARIAASEANAAEQFNKCWDKYNEVF